MFMIPRKEFIEKGKKWDLYAIGVTFEKALKIIIEKDPKKLLSRDVEYLTLLASSLKSHETDGYIEASQAVEDIDKNMQTLGTELLVPELAPFPRVTRRLPPNRSIPFSEKISMTYRHPWLKRLRNVKQLGLAHYVYDGATHSRLEHSLGVFGNAVRYTKALLSGSFDQYFRRIIHDKELYTLFAAALLHDIGHFPFAHAFEDINPIFRHEKITCKILSGELDSCLPDCDRPIKDVIEQEWGIDIQNVSAIINKRVDATFDVDKTGILRSILSGPVDIDKLDYLWRDSLHIGLPYGQRLDDNRFLQSLAVHPIKKNTIALQEKGRVGAELIIQARYQMYSEVYWYHEVRAYEAMLSTAVDFFIKTVRLSDNYIIEKLLKSNDDQVLDWLYDQGNDVVKELIKAILDDKPHQTVLQYQKKDPTHGEIWETLVDWRWEHKNKFDYFFDLLEKSFAEKTGLIIKHGQLILDIPNPHRYKIGSVDVIMHDNPVPQPLSYVSLLWKSVEEDFQNWVQKLRIFAVRELKEKIQSLGPVEIEKTMEECKEKTSGETITSR